METAKHQPDLRDHLAAERTFLAWIRTGATGMGFGFVVARFGIFLQKFQLTPNGPWARTYDFSLWPGTGASCGRSPDERHYRHGITPAWCGS